MHRFIQENAFLQHFQSFLPNKGTSQEDGAVYHSERVTILQEYGSCISKGWKTIFTTEEIEGTET